MKVELVVIKLIVDTDVDTATSAARGVGLRVKSTLIS